MYIGAWQDQKITCSHDMRLCLHWSTQHENYIYWWARSRNYSKCTIP